MATYFPVLASQSFTDLSKEALAMSLASGEKHTSIINCWCPEDNNIKYIKYIHSCNMEAHTVAKLMSACKKEKSEKKC